MCVCARVHACARMRVRPCVRPCVHPRVNACVRACVRDVFAIYDYNI